MPRPISYAVFCLKKKNLAVVFYGNGCDVEIQEDVKANFIYAGRDVDAVIKDGRITLHAVPLSAVGESIHIIFESGKYSLKDRPIVIPEPGEILQVALLKKKEFTIVSGEVRDADF